MPRVSVVIPAYNPGDFLGRAVDSVLAQTVSDLEVVVVDDGSPEDLSWVGEHADTRVRFHRQRNGGVSVARNVGAFLSTSELVAFLDQDDVWDPRKLELQLAALEVNPAVAFCHTEFTWVSDHNEEPGRQDRPISYHGLLQDQHVCLSSVVVARERYFEVGGHDPLLRQMQDFDLFLRLTRRFGPPVVVRGSQVDYHLHAGNASSDFRTAARERRALLRLHRQVARDSGDRATAQAASAGLARTHDLYSAQALDALLRDVHAANWSNVPGQVVDVVRLSPSRLPSAVTTSLLARFRRDRGQ